MPFFGELFVSEILKKQVLDPKGEELGTALGEKLPGTGAYLWPGPPPADGSA